ncbi:hypothetical protein ACFOYW_07985 [Gryllotalpicola reticulitermitis]|uniref:Ribosomally synthesized peptide with SipW-like signal peptide n=1 Tax=Gryllotalpicola reticulitermitis TaxID=1184153 RepID=A0ABV8Q4M1_9MICO
MTEELRPRAPKKARLSGRQRKIFAIVGAAAVLGIGVTASLAAWTGNQWVYGGTGNDGSGSAITTSTFDVQQNTGIGPDETAAGTWDSLASNAADGTKGQLSFSTPALNLTPGVDTYAPVALETTSGSVAGTITTIHAAVGANGAAAADYENALWNNLHVRIAASSSTFTCDATAFTTTSSSITVVQPDELLSAGTDTILPTGSSAETLQSGSQSQEYYCFDIWLPSQTALQGLSVAPASLMGLSVAPAWNFEYTSN